MSELDSVDEAFIEDAADDLAGDILTDLSDRAGIPEWLGDFAELPARQLRRDIAGELIVPAMRALLRDRLRRPPQLPDLRHRGGKPHEGE